MFGLLLAMGFCAGCSSMMDPTNAQARADKMQKAVAAQRNNGMSTAPKSAPQAPK